MRWPSFKDTRRQLAAEVKQRVTAERQSSLLAVLKTLPREQRSQAEIAKRLGTTQAAISREVKALGLCSGCFRALDKP